MQKKPKNTLSKISHVNVCEKDELYVYYTLIIIYSRIICLRDM